ncbi:MAG: alpha/beta hydrolase [Betaproteobacteria bacterium]|nr:alpha/beta hydrolase [Betaproteobacteria bacterium]
MRRGVAVFSFICGAALMIAPAHAQSANTAIGGAALITTDGVRLNVLEAGPRDAAAAAPVIALLPGWSMPAAIWRTQLVTLGATHRVAALDPRGQGDSEIAPSGYTIERRAADIHEFVARYSRVILVGWSLGALEALHYVHRYGDAAIEGLVLVDSSVGEDPVPPAGSEFRDALKRDRRATLDEFVRGMFRTPRAESEIAQLREAALRMPLEASLSLFPGHIRREHWRGIARAFRKPLLYAVSAQFGEQARALRRARPRTRIAVFENAGHALFVDEPERFNRLITDFVGEIAASTR